ncbi:MAG: C39 family peptidase, partial [Deltaproteobacteria bacterium]|nr:C39 family peptidase [Deltaproteobacteria bacterium]
PSPPPGSTIDSTVWRRLSPEDRADIWKEQANRQADLAPGETTKNEKLHDYLIANPDVKTVQDLVNKTWSSNTFYTTCDELGVDSKELLKYRKIALRDWAVNPAPPSGTAPRTVEEANKVFLNQYNTDFNQYYDKSNVSNNCGPTSLAMALQVAGKMPPGLNSEQQIDYARGLMYPNLDERSYKHVTDANGKEVRLLDNDSDLTNIDEVVTGAAQAGITTSHEKGWNELDAALNAGQTAVVEGNISGTWRSQFSNSGVAGSYAGGGNGHFIAVLGKTSDGNYLVADPMFSGGAVEMSRDQLAVFFAKQAGEPSFVAIEAAKQQAAPTVPAWRLSQML